MTLHVPEMLFDCYELHFFTATFTATANPGTFSDHDLAAYAQAYTGRERLRGGLSAFGGGTRARTAGRGPADFGGGRCQALQDRPATRSGAGRAATLEHEPGGIEESHGVGARWVWRTPPPPPAGIRWPKPGPSGMLHV
ncbi:hypothetical protein STENM327S_00325 [Streptomyces tendae]